MTLYLVVEVVEEVEEVGESDDYYNPYGRSSNETTYTQAQIDEQARLKRARIRRGNKGKTKRKRKPIKEKITVVLLIKIVEIQGYTVRLFLVLLRELNLEYVKEKPVKYIVIVENVALITCVYLKGQT